MMDRDKILKASLSRYGHKYQFKTRKAFEHGARWMEEQNQAEIDELNNKVSELTEALDASYIFCEGVRDLTAEKAWGWFCRNFDKFTEGIRLEDAVKLHRQFNQAMKGE